MLDNERDYFKEALPSLLATKAGQFVLIKDRELLGTYSTINEALVDGAQRFGLEPFLVRKIEEHEQSIFNTALSLGILSANPAHTIRR